MIRAGSHRGRALVGVLLVACSPVFPAFATPPARDVAACLRSALCDQVFVVAHRGRGYGGADNSREAIGNAIAAGQRVIEVDLRLTRDGTVVVFHNRRLDGVTSGRGEVADRSADDLRHVELPNHDPVPVFAEVYDLARGRAVLVLHFKVDAVEAVADWIASHGSFDDVVFYLDDWSLVEAAARSRERHPAMIVMTHAVRRGDLWRAESLLGHLPTLVHIAGDDPARVAWFRRHGVKAAIKSLGLEGLWAHEREYRRLRAWASGAQLIIVDEPSFFALGGPVRRP